MRLIRYAAFTCISLALGLGTSGLAEDRITLFNGRDLEGWVVEGPSQVDGEDGSRPIWTVQDGKIVCEGFGFGFLRYAARSFDDFEFHVEYRMEPKGNSGIGIRTRPFDPAQSRATRPSFYSYEIQLVDDAGQPASPHSTGSLYRYVAPSSNPVKPAGEWNTLDVRCVGPRIQITLNGELIQDVDQSTVEQLRDKPLSGHLCLQNHGRRVEFRNLWVREIHPEAP